MTREREVEDVVGVEEVDIELTYPLVLILIHSLRICLLLLVIFLVLSVVLI